MKFRSLFLTTSAASLVVAQTNNTGICYSWGVDFIDEGSYFINSASTEQFTAVSYFRGCNEDVADVLLVAPEGDQVGEYLCSQVPTTPDNENQLSTCPIQKDQMISGHWLLLVLGNNGDCGQSCQPFAWQRGMLQLPTSVIDSKYGRSLSYSRHSGHKYNHTYIDIEPYYYTD